MTYPMTLDGLNRAVTGVVVAIMGGLLCMLALEPVPAKAPVAVVIACALLLSFAFSPCGLEVTDTEVRVLRRLAPPVRLPLATLRSIEPSNARGLRVFGSGGFFGSFGLYWQKGLGTYRRYGTKLEPAMLLTRTVGLPVVVTPDDGAGFRNAVLAKLPRS